MTSPARAYGERALLVPLEEGADPRAALAWLRRAPGASDVILAESVACVVAPQDAAGPPAPPRGALPSLTDAPPTRTHEIHVVYDGADLAEIAARAGLSTDEVVRRHTGGDCVATMMGFLPGFAYLRGLDPSLSFPRRASPRPRVPAGAVAIAAEYTGIYPFASPGGWHLLGRAIGFSPLDGDGPRVTIGDRVRFSAVSPRGPAPEPPPRASAPRAVSRGVAVSGAVGLALVVDRGREGFMHAGFPRSGPLSPRAFARANAAARNPSGAAAIELYGELELTAVGTETTLADDDGRVVRLSAGASARFSSGQGRCRYVAVRGGVDVAPVMGSRTTLLVAGLGGHEGRALRRGDVLPVGELDALATEAPETPRRHVAPPTIALAPGPDAGELEGALEALSASAWRVSPSSDRTGTRLSREGVDAAPLARLDARRASIPMIEGAVQLTPAGPVVLGPDHPTTGGYPVVAVLGRDALDALACVPLGGLVRLRPP